MNNKGFTLVELIAVIAILAIASALIATRFFSLTGDQNYFEDATFAKALAEAAYIYYGSESESKCISSKTLIDNGYISEDQGLLKNYQDNDEIYQFAVWVSINSDTKEKETKVYKVGSGVCGEGELNCCSAADATLISE